MARVLRSGTLTNGPETQKFEVEFAARHAVEHAVAVANGTVGLAAIFLGLGIGPGDEVVVPSFTFISSATSVMHVGAHPVFADVDPTRFNLDPADVARCLTPRTKAILAVHYGGQPADMDELRALADEAAVYLIEDAAEAHGASYRGRPVGGLGHAAMFSFTPTKNITTGEGGIVTTADSELATRIRLLRNHGQTGPYLSASVGYNWRLTEMQAAMGRVQLERLDGIIAAKQEKANRLGPRIERIEGVRPPQQSGDRTHTFMLYSIVVESARDVILGQMLEHGVEARLYFPPAHAQPVFRGISRELPVTEWLAEHLLSLPFHHRLSETDLDEILSILSEVVEGARAGSPTA